MGNDVCRHMSVVSIELMRDFANPLDGTGWDLWYLIRNVRIRSGGARMAIRRIASRPAELPSGYFCAFDGAGRGDFLLATIYLAKWIP